MDASIVAAGAEYNEILMLLLEGSLRSKKTLMVVWEITFRK